MGKTLRNRAAWLALCGFLAVGSLATADDSPAEKLLAEIKAIEMPKVPQDRTNQAAFQDYMSASRAAATKKAALIGELFQIAPETPELATMLPFRWQTLMTPDTASTMKTEIDMVLTKTHDEKLIAECYFSKWVAAILAAPAESKMEEPLADWEIFAKKVPNDPRVPTMLMTIANRADDPDAQEKLFQRIEKDYSKSPVAKQVAGARARAEGERKKLARVGKPFELEFTEATKGTHITMASLKGKVVVIDFWATWCGPCIAEMPNMKKLYAEYKDKGVEFIGVSLDQPVEKGGLEKLSTYVQKNGIEWPQYYQGNYWQSAFSASWGINSIPCVFLVDAEGNLASIKARGKLEKMIPEYLEKAKAKKTASNP